MPRFQIWFFAVLGILVVVIILWVQCLTSGGSTRQPGPIIDIKIGTGGTVKYEIGQTDVGTTSMPDKLHPDFFKKMLNNRLLLTQTPGLSWAYRDSAESGPIVNGQGNVGFKFERGGGDTLNWWCDADGNGSYETRLYADGGAKIPPCMTGNDADSKFTSGGNEGQWIHIGTEQ